MKTDQTLRFITKSSTGSQTRLSLSPTLVNLGETLYIDEEKQVGINTLTPNAKLHIKNDLVSDDVLLDNNGNNLTTLGFANNGVKMGEIELNEGGNSFNINSLKDNQSIKINSKTSTSAPLKVNITPTDIFMYGDINLSNAVKIESGDVSMPSGIKFGGSTAGNIRFSGGDFQGFNGSEWVSLTTKSIQETGFWQQITSGNAPFCPTGYSRGLTSSGKACNNGYGTNIRFVDNQYPTDDYYECVGSLTQQLTSVWCLKIN